MKPRSHMPGTGLSFGFRAAIAIAVLVGGYLLFEFGRLQADYNIVDTIAEKQDLYDEIDGLEGEIAGLKQEIALLETHREIDREAYKVVEDKSHRLTAKDSGTVGCHCVLSRHRFTERRRAWAPCSGLEADQG